MYKEGLKNKKRDTEGYDHSLDNCTFTPQLYYSSIQPGGNINDFLERQQFYKELKKEREVSIFYLTIIFRRENYLNQQTKLIVHLLHK